MNRLIKKSFALVALVGALTAFSTANANAAYLTGNFSYAGLGATTDSNADLSAATQITVPVAVSGGGTLDFATLVVGLPIAHVSPLVFAPFAPYAPLWGPTLGFSFDLLTLTIDPATDVDTLVLTGTGTFHKAGFDDTPGTWSLTSQGANGQFVGTFSVSQSVTVPEPLSLSLLGLGLAGVAIRRRATR